MWRSERAQEPRAWPPRVGHARVLIEDADGASQWAASHLLERAGFDVAVCDGPELLPKGRCPLITSGSCPLVEGADVVFNHLPLTRAPNRALLSALRTTSPATPVIVEATRPRARDHADALVGCRVLAEPADPRALVAEVEAAVVTGGAAAPG